MEVDLAARELARGRNGRLTHGGWVRRRGGCMWAVCVMPIGSDSEFVTLCIAGGMLGAYGACTWWGSCPCLTRRIRSGSADGGGRPYGGQVRFSCRSIGRRCSRAAARFYRVLVKARNASVVL